MIVGHALVAFALVATVAAALGWDEERALALGIVAGAFAVVPDVDMLYAVVGVAQAGLGATGSVGESVWRATGVFWRSSGLVHRAVTHSLVVAVPAAVAFTWATRGRPWRAAAAAFLAGLVAVTYAESGPLGAAVMLAFVAAGVAVAAATARRTDLSGRELFGAAFAGLASHPFGDLFTGEPPQFLYPLDVTLVPARVTLLGDPTLNLLAVFALELATVWLALAVYCRLTRRPTVSHADWRAALGASYAIAALVLPAPTLDVSYHFVFSILAVGFVGATPRTVPSLPPSVDRTEALPAAVTGLCAITLAALTYTAVYLTA